MRRRRFFAWLAGLFVLPSTRRIQAEQQKMLDNPEKVTERSYPASGYSVVEVFHDDGTTKSISYHFDKGRFEIGMSRWDNDAERRTGELQGDYLSRGDRSQK